MASFILFTDLDIKLCFVSHSHVPSGGLLREILSEDNRRKRLTYPEDNKDSTLDDALPEIERKAVDLLLGEELSYVDRLPLSSSDDSTVSEPDDPLHDDSLLKDLFYTTRVSDDR